MQIDWKNGSWISENHGQSSSTWRMTLASEWAPRGSHERIMVENPTAIYGDLLPLLRASDLNIVNIECTLGSKGEAIPKGGPNIRCNEQAVGALYPFHIACFANNHVMDYGPESLAYTLNAVQKEGLKTIGAGMTGDEAGKPVIVKVKDTTTGIINCGEREECQSVDNGPGANGFDLVEISKQISNLKETTDVILVIFHGGRENVPVPPEYVINNLRQVAGMGVDAVIAHHPHVPQGIEFHGQVPVVYGQGNFAFWQNSTSFFQHAGYLVHLEFTEKRLSKLELTPYLIESEGLRQMKGKMRGKFLNDLKDVSGLLQSQSNIRDVWNAVVDMVGMEGMIQQLQTGMDRLSSDVPRGAAWLHNLFYDPSHRDVYTNGLKRAAQGNLGDSPDWAKKLVDYWQTYSIDEAKSEKD